MTPDVPTITATAATCSANGISTISNYVSGTVYTFDPAGPSVDNTGLISGMIVGTSYKVTAGNGSCTSASSNSFSNAVKLVTPDVPTITATAPTCSANGISTISNYVSGTVYTFDPAGPSVDNAGLISGMIVGTSYKVTAGNGSCTSASLNSFSNAAKLITPDVPTITSINQLTCSVNTGSFTISNYNNSYSYTITPAGATLDALTGIVTAPVGTYDVTATLSNCTSGISTVVIVSKICANDDNFGTKTSGATALNLGDVTSNDKLNGLAVTTTNTNVTPKIEGPLSVDADGNLTLAANTASGTYSIIYQICEEGSASANCDTTTASVIVANGLVANDDNFGTKTSGATALNLGDVTSNDKLNGLAVTTTNTNVTPKIEGPLSVDADGNLTLAPNTASGTYSIVYQICEEGSASANCDTATASVIVANGLVANDDNFGTKTSGATAINLGDVTSNDKLNGLAVTTTSTNVTPKIEGPLSVDVDANLTLAPNTASGTYSIVYQICEEGSVSANCDTATASVIVANGLVANDDNFGTKTSGATALNLGDVTSNDKLNGLAVTTANTNVTPKIEGPLSVDADGNLTLAANTASGTYSIIYQICEEGSASANCDTATATVIVANGLVANDDNFGTKTSGATALNLGDVTSNDKLNGLAVTTTNTNVTPKIEGPLSVDADGNLTLAANTASGTYSIIYQICEEGSASANCDTATASVIVANGLVANDDNFGTKTSGATALNLGDVTSNDKLNGLAVTTTNTNVTPKIEGPLSVDADGNLTLAANTASGTYSIIYQICEEGSASANCDTATATVVVKNVIKAVIETTLPINGSIGGTTASLTANDTLNGDFITIENNPGEVTLNIVGTLPTGLTLNANGTITVSPGTPKGDYNVEYTICETGSNPANCDSVISVVTVTAGNLVANPDTVTSVVGINIPQTIVNVFTNDTKNGLPLDPADVKLTNSTPDPKGYLTLNPDGTVTLAPNAPAGDYELTYTICEVLNLSNCKSNTVTVTVTAPIMTVTANSYCSNNVPYVRYNVKAENFTPNNLLTIKWIDSANNVVATQTNLPLSGDLLWPGAVIDSNGNGVDWPGWLLKNNQWIEGADGFENARANVTMEFSLNPTVNVIVNYPPATPQCNARPTFVIQANNDTDGPVDLNKGTNLSINIFNNDVLNGTIITPSNVVLTTTVPNSNLVLNADGTVAVKSGTPSGTYELTYQICEAANQSNCSQAVVKVTVLNSVDPKLPLIAKDDLDISVDGINGEIEFINVLDNDLLDGLPIKLIDVTITNNSPSPYFEFNPDGTVSVKPNTPGGNYALTYQICQKASSGNCTTATLNVFVEVPAIAIVKTATFNDENKNGIANAGETITYNFVVTNTGNVPLVDVKVIDPLPGVVVSGQPIDLAVNESNSTNFTASYTIKQSDINAGKVSNQASVSGNSVRGVKVDDVSDDAGVDGDKPTVLDLNGCQIKVFNAFSPNGDSKNARFYIQGLECYPDNTVEIYNRWGVLVFDIDGYNNEDRVFVGISAGRATVTQADGLPVGTYFYVLKYRDSESNQHEKSGYLYINK
ncbi:T9SS type B sorting domain-containing protein [Flavobacterium branchiicola]|nr:gliding motility-associated C-terminal domain-containing protein [Flavobacterium branchiicola]